MADITFEPAVEKSYNELVGGKKKRVRKTSKKDSELKKIEKSAINAIKTLITPDMKKNKKLANKTMKDAVKIKAVKKVENFAEKIVKKVKNLTDKVVKKVKKL